jgi:hypothetical protein
MQMEVHLDEMERLKATGEGMGVHGWQDTDQGSAGAAGAGAGASDDLKRRYTVNPMASIAKDGKQSWVELESKKKAAVRMMAPFDSESSLAHAPRLISQSTPVTDDDKVATAAVRSRTEATREIQTTIRPQLKQLFASLVGVEQEALHNYDGKVSLLKLVKALKRDDDESCQLRKLLCLPEQCSIEDESTQEAFEIFISNFSDGADEISLQQLLAHGDEQAKKNAKANWQRTKNMAALFAKKTRTDRAKTEVASGE